MELRHLRYFVRVAEDLHFGNAARRLGISQPPLSQQIRALELELGLPLFERSSRKVILTEAGRLFLVEAKRALEQTERAVEVARRAREGEVGEISVGFTASVPFVPDIANALFRFRQSHPFVHLRFHELPRDRQITALAERQLDIGIARSARQPIVPEGLNVTQLMHEKLLIAMRPDHRLASRKAGIKLAELEAEPFILYDRSMGAGFNDHLLDLCRSAGFEPKLLQEASGPTTLLGLVAAGFGITIVARSFSALHLDNVEYREIEDPDAMSSLWLVHQNTVSPSCACLISGILNREAPPISAPPARPLCPHTQ